MQNGRTREDEEGFEALFALITFKREEDSTMLNLDHNFIYVREKIEKEYEKQLPLSN
jgi:hypothetical protein